MANITDFILKQVTSATGGVNIPSNVKEQVLGGLASSVFGSLTQSMAQPGGMEAVTGLLTGKADAATSPVTALAGSLFTNNILSKLNLGSLGTTLAALIPGIMGKLSGFLKDQDGDGDVDLKDILLALRGGGPATQTQQTQASTGGGILGAAASILGGLFGGGSR